MLDLQPCMNMGAKRQPQPPGFPQHQPAPCKRLQDPPLPLPASRTGWPQQGARTAPTITPCSWGWGAWHASQRGLCPACSPLGSRLAHGHKGHWVLHHLFQNQSGGKEDLSVPGRQQYPTQGGAFSSQLPWRSSLIQSQHNGAELVLLILLGRRSRCGAWISNGCLPHGIQSQHSTFHGTPWWKPSETCLWSSWWVTEQWWQLHREIRSWRQVRKEKQNRDQSPWVEDRPVQGSQPYS